MFTADSQLFQCSVAEDFSVTVSNGKLFKSDFDREVKKLLKA